MYSTIKKFLTAIMVLFGLLSVGLVGGTVASANHNHIRTTKSKVKKSYKSKKVMKKKTTRKKTAKKNVKNRKARKSPVPTEKTYFKGAFEEGFSYKVINGGSVVTPTITNDYHIPGPVIKFYAGDKSPYYHAIVDMATTAWNKAMKGKIILKETNVKADADIDIEAVEASQEIIDCSSYGGDGFVTGVQKNSNST